MRHLQQGLARQQVAATVRHGQRHDADRQSTLSRILLQACLIGPQIGLIGRRADDDEREGPVRVPGAAVQSSDDLPHRCCVEDNLQLALRASIVTLDVLRRVGDQATENRIARRLPPPRRAHQCRTHGLLHGGCGLACHIDLEHRHRARRPGCRRQSGAGSEQQRFAKKALRGCRSAGHWKCLDRATGSRKMYNTTRAIPPAQVPGCGARELPIHLPG